MGGRTVSSSKPGRCNKDACDQRVLPRRMGEACSWAGVEGAGREEGEAGRVGASREAGSREGLRRRLRSWQAGELKWKE